MRDGAQDGGDAAERAGRCCRLLTSRAIQEQGLISINDIAQFTPGLSFSQAFGRTIEQPGIRGQSNVPNALPLGRVRYQDEAKFDSTTPRLTLDWQATDHLMVYGIFAQGAKPGGLNGIAGQSIGIGTYEQEESDNFELGSKLSMFDNRLRLSAAAYFTQSVPSATGQGAVTSVATNQGEGETMGLEFEIEAAITLSAGYAYTDTEITKGCDDFQYTLNTAGIIYDPALGNVPECSIRGNRYPLVAEQNANFVLNYDAPTQSGAGLSWISNFSVTYEGSKFVQVHNLVETGETTLVNLRTGSTNSTPGVPCNPATATVPCGPPATSPAGYPVTGAPGTGGGADTGSPRGFFGALRRGRTFGLDFNYDFKL